MFSYFYWNTNQRKVKNKPERAIPVFRRTYSNDEIMYRKENPNNKEKKKVNEGPDRVENSSGSNRVGYAENSSSY